MSYELIALCMFAAMMALMLTGQRVFAMVGAVAAAAMLKRLPARAAAVAAALAAAATKQSLKPNSQAPAALPHGGVK